jgi:hypothetical protein
MLDAPVHPYNALTLPPAIHAFVSAVLSSPACTFFSCACVAVTQRIWPSAYRDAPVICLCDIWLKGIQALDPAIRQSACFEKNERK